MEPENFKGIVIALLVLIVIYMIMRRRTEKLKLKRNERPGFRRKR